MKPADATQPRPRGSAKIDPAGRIHLGRRLTLEQRSRAALATGFSFSAGLPEDGLIAPFEDSLPMVHRGELPRQELDYELRETGDDLFIERAGLTMSYGIFGAPGAGKTRLMMRLLRQLLALES